MRILASAVAALVFVTQAASAQQMDMDMQGMAMDRPHMTMTPHWDEKPGDRARADSIVRVARAAVERYQDVAVAESDGFKRFAPQIRHQRVYHYTSASAALKTRFKFDADLSHRAALPGKGVGQPQVGRRHVQHAG